MSIYVLGNILGRGHEHTMSMAQKILEHTGQVALIMK